MEISENGILPFILFSSQKNIVMKIASCRFRYLSWVRVLYPFLTGHWLSTEFRQTLYLSIFYIYSQLYVVIELFPFAPFLNLNYFS